VVEDVPEQHGPSAVSDETHKCDPNTLVEHFLHNALELGMVRHSFTDNESCITVSYHNTLQILATLNKFTVCVGLILQGSFCADRHISDQFQKVHAHKTVNSSTKFLYTLYGCSQPPQVPA